MTDADKIRQFIAKRAARDPAERPALRDHTPLLEDRYLDSFGVLELAAFIEEAFDVHFEKDELKPGNFATVNAVLELVRSKRGRKGAA
jgi:acyl carrier protein